GELPRVPGRAARSSAVLNRARAMIHPGRRPPANCGASAPARCCRTGAAPRGLAEPPIDQVEHRGCRPSGVLRLSVAEGPVLLLHLDQGNEHVLLPETEALVQTVRDRPVERLLQLGAPALVEDDLDEDAVRAALDAEIGPVDDQLFGRVLG